MNNIQTARAEAIEAIRAALSALEAASEKDFGVSATTKDWSMVGDLARIAEAAEEAARIAKNLAA